MKTLKYIVRVHYVENNGKEINLEVNASSAEDLFKKLKDVLDSKSKWNISKLFK